MNHSVTATASNNRNSSNDGTYLRRLLSFFIVFPLISRNFPNTFYYFTSSSSRPQFFFLSAVLYGDFLVFLTLPPAIVAGERHAGKEILHAQSSFLAKSFSQWTRSFGAPGRRCGDMRMLLHKCILRIKGHGAVFAAIGAIRKHQARLCRVPQLRI